MRGHRKAAFAQPRWTSEASSGPSCWTRPSPERYCARPPPSTAPPLAPRPRSLLRRRLRPPRRSKKTTRPQRARKAGGGGGGGGGGEKGDSAALALDPSGFPFPVPTPRPLAPARCDGPVQSAEALRWRFVVFEAARQLLRDDTELLKGWAARRLQRLLAPQFPFAQLPPSAGAAALVLCGGDVLRAASVLSEPAAWDGPAARAAGGAGGSASGGGFGGSAVPLRHLLVALTGGRTEGEGPGLRGPAADPAASLAAGPPNSLALALGGLSELAAGDGRAVVLGAENRYADHGCGGGGSR